MTLKFIYFGGLVFVNFALVAAVIRHVVVNGIAVLPRQFLSKPAPSQIPIRSVQDSAGEREVPSSPQTA